MARGGGGTLQSSGGRLVCHPTVPRHRSRLPLCSPLPCTLAVHLCLFTPAQPSLLWAPLNPTGLLASHVILASTAIRPFGRASPPPVTSVTYRLFTEGKRSVSSRRGTCSRSLRGVVGVLQRRLGAGPLMDGSPRCQHFPSVPPFRHLWIHILAHSPSPSLPDFMWALRPPR